ncbi:MAG: aminotransferase class III-fold pyridoxal phosphate-dependent enzyme [Armatimonadetes bacterium]|nr:aminotransferase class III-fold pyridoxal phosphate-dependent enzyme [Armatimonadota bacterium]
MSQSSVTEYTAQEVIDLNREYSLFSWAAQSKLNPIPVARAKGVYFWDVDGKRYIDFSSQLMNVNIGHGHPKVIEAIKRQVETLAFVYPGMATRARGEAARALAEITPAPLKKTFFTLGGSEAIENSMKIARLYTGRQKVISRYRSYHGATFGAMTAGGDPRRLANEPGVPWIVRTLDPYPYRNPIYRHCTPEQGDLVLADILQDQVEMEGPENIAAILLEGYCGSSGLMAPSKAYWKRVRELCDRYGIVLIVDEVMSGFGRTGKWFGIDHYDVDPDILACAKGLTSGYVPLGATVVSEKIAQYFDDNPLWCGLTYSSHPVGCAAAAACIQVYKDDRLLENAQAMGQLMEKHLKELQDRHPCIGEYRGIGLFYLLELVKNRSSREPMSGWNRPHTEPMLKVAGFLREKGLSTFVRWDWVFCVPPLCITPEQLQEGIEIIDEALSLADPYVEG